MFWDSTLSEILGRSLYFVRWVLTEICKLKWFHTSNIKLFKIEIKNIKNRYFSGANTEYYRKQSLLLREWENIRFNYTFQTCLVYPGEISVISMEDLMILVLQFGSNISFWWRTIHTIRNSYEIQRGIM